MVQPSIPLLALLWLLVTILFPFIILLVVGTLIHRWIVTLVLCKIFHPEFVRLVTGLDVGFSLDNFWTKPRGAIAFVYTIDGPIDVDEIKRRLTQLLLSPSNAENYERLTQIYPKIWCTFPFWTRISEGTFQVENHIRADFSDLNDSSLNSVIRDWLQSPFKFECPLWDVLIVPFNKESQNKLVFGFRIHHAVGDGYSMLQFLQNIFDEDKLISPPVQKPLRIPILERIWNELKLTTWTPFAMLQFTHDFFLHNDWLMRKKISDQVIFATTSVKLSDLKQVRRKVNVSLNTIILHLFGGALRRYLVQTFPEEDLPDGTIVVCSLPVLGSDHPIGTFCNHWSHGTFTIPLKMSDKTLRLNMLQTNVTNVLGLQMQKVYTRFAKAVAILPVFLLRKLINHNVSASMGLANLPGPSHSVFLTGQRVERKLAVVGIQWKHASIMLSAVSYDGELTISVTAHSDVIPSEEVADRILNVFFLEELQAELTESNPFTTEKAADVSSCLTANVN